jgi:GT2 family glycosyltransferase
VDLSIIILNWNTVRLTRACLESIYAYPPDCPFEVIVADNASSDRSREMVREEFPQARLIHHSTNLGFCAGNNRAAEQANGKYFLFLNSDTEVFPNALNILVDYLNKHSNAGIIGPKLLNPDGSLQYSCRRFPNMGTGFFRNTPLGRLFPQNKFAGDYLMKDFDHASVRDVDWLSGAALCSRADLWRELGGFDEAYYMFCEDVDVCYRAHEKGWEVVYVPDAVITHHIGQSTNLVPARMTYYFHRSMYRFYQKHYAAKTPLIVRPLIIPGLIARASGQIAKYRWRRMLQLMSKGGKR